MVVLVSELRDFSFYGSIRASNILFFRQILKVKGSERCFIGPSSFQSFANMNAGNFL